MALRERKARVGAIPEGGMADIAFLLLVFFLVTTTIDMDKGLGIILPAEAFAIHEENLQKKWDYSSRFRRTEIYLWEARFNKAHNS